MPRTDPASNNILVCGAPRTGTTLLQSLICECDGFNPMIGEVALLRYLVEAYERTELQVRKNPGKLFDQVEEIQVLYRSYVSQLLDYLREKYACPRLIIKEPELTHHIPGLYSLTQDWLFLFIVRDPKDAIASMRTWGRAQSEKGEEHFFHMESIEYLSRYYTGFYTPLLRMVDSDIWLRVRFIRYEDLVSEPKDILPSIYEFIGCSTKRKGLDKVWTSSRLSLRKEREAFNAAITELYGKGISASSVGRYKQVLEQEDVVKIEKHCGYLMSFFEY